MALKTSLWTTKGCWSAHYEEQLFWLWTPKTRGIAMVCGTSAPFPTVPSHTTVNSKCWRKGFYGPYIGWYILWIVSECLNTRTGDSGYSCAGCGTSVLNSTWHLSDKNLCHLNSFKIQYSGSLWQGVPHLNYILWMCCTFRVFLRINAFSSESPVHT